MSSIPNHKKLVMLRLILKKLSLQPLLDVEYTQVRFLFLFILEIKFIFILSFLEERIIDRDSGAHKITKQNSPHFIHTIIVASILILLNLIYAFCF